MSEKVDPALAARMRHRCHPPQRQARRADVWRCPECGRHYRCTEESIPVPPGLWGRSILGMAWEDAGAARWRRFLWPERRIRALLGEAQQ